MGPEDIIIAIAGNKSDLEDRREVSTEMAKKYAQKLEDERGMGQSALFFETSAKEDMNVKAIFEELSTFTRRGVRGEGGRRTTSGQRQTGGWASASDCDCDCDCDCETYVMSP